MRKKIEIIDDRNNDRVIGVLRDENGQVDNISFFQGDFSADTIEGMAESLLNAEITYKITILKIYSQVLSTKKYDSLEDAIIETVELYCIAFIYEKN